MRAPAVLFRRGVLGRLHLSQSKSDISDFDHVNDPNADKSEFGWERSPREARRVRGYTLSAETGTLPGVLLLPPPLQGRVGVGVIYGAVSGHLPLSAVSISALVLSSYCVKNAASVRLRSHSSGMCGGNSYSNDESQLGSPTDERISS